MLQILTGFTTLHIYKEGEFFCEHDVFSNEVTVASLMQWVAQEVFGASGDQVVLKERQGYYAMLVSDEQLAALLKNPANRSLEFDAILIPK